MNNKVISIIGGYGATGTVVAKKLALETQCIINIVGRNQAKAEQLAREIGGNTRAVIADIFDESTLQKVFLLTDIVVNCAGPSAKIKEKVAKLAFLQGCDYIDAGGYEFTYEILKQDGSYVRDKNLSCVLSAGWIPGVAEVLANYSDIKANEIFEKKENMTLYYGDRNTWLDAGLLDTIQYIKGNSMKDMAIVKDGKLKKQFGLGFAKSFNLPFGIGRQLGFLHFIPELKPFALNNSDYSKINSYLVLFGWYTFFTMMKIKFFLRTDDACICALRNAYKKEVDRKGILGVAVSEITGWKNNQRVKYQAGIISRGGYELTGFGCAATVILKLNNKVKPGLHYLPEAIEAIDFMDILTRWGVKITENSFEI